MRAIAGREFARMIERRGWQLLRVSGSHLAKLAGIPEDELR